MSLPATTTPTGFHKHQCRWCAYVWQHHDINDVRHGDMRSPAS